MGSGSIECAAPATRPRIASSKRTGSAPGVPPFTGVTVGDTASALTPSRASTAAPNAPRRRADGACRAAAATRTPSPICT